MSERRSPEGVTAPPHVSRDGERVRAEPAPAAAQHARGPGRVKPGTPVVARCRHFGECGGCDRQDVAYPEQLRQKRIQVEALLRAALGARMPHVAAVIGMPVGADGMPWHFRQKAAFVFGADAGGALTMGHFARGTNRIVPVVECPVHGQRANRIAFALRDELAKEGLRAASEPGGLLRHVLVRTTEDESEAAAVLVVARDDPSVRAPLQRLLASPERPTGLMLNLHDRPGPYLVGRETLRIDGPGHVREERLGASFLVSPTGFFQTNVRAAAELLRLVQEGLPRRAGLRVLELYAGSGLFALQVARLGHTVTAVEESRKALRDAALNGRANGVPEERLRLVCARVEDALPRLSRRRYDAVILDPPREGCPPQVLRTVAQRIEPERLILVSCHPEALARELTVAFDAGYTAELIQPVDMFPHTAHIEVVAVLNRRKPRAALVRERAQAEPPAPAAPSRRPGVERAHSARKAEAESRPARAARNAGK